MASGVRGSQHLDLEAIDFDLHALAMSAFATFSPLGEERGLRMQCVIDPSVPVNVRGDPVRVRQILANYLSNALKFTSQGSITLSVCPARSGRVRLAVQDTGVGVAEDLRERLFTPFSQADSSTTRRFGGTGLGLSICRELAQRMGGAVGVDSDGHSGSCFWADLTLAASADALPEARGPNTSELPLASVRLLVAEDNPVNMLIIVATLQRLGAQVIRADDGAMALALAREHAGLLHAVLMDLHMPLVDGLAATRQLRADPLTRHLPIIALSAASLEHERQAARAAGMDDFVAKPINDVELGTR